MRDLEKSYSRRRGSSRFGTLLVLSAMTAGGVYAYRHYFHRAGEDALHLIPADALMVVTVDTLPAPGQALTFKRIGDAVKAEHLDTQIEEALSRSLSNSPLARDMRPFAAGSMAFATLKTNGGASNGNGDSAVFLALRDADQAAGVLARDAQRNNSNGLDYYQTTGDTHCMAIIGSYLVTTDKPADLAQIEAVRKGESPAIAAQADYQQARAGLPADSNLMLFVSANGISQAAQGAGNDGSTGLFARVSRSRPYAHYVAMGMAIHDQGIDTVVQVPLDAPQGAAGGEVSRIAPLSDNIWRSLPSGAYGVIAASQPGKYYAYAAAAAGQDAEARRMLHEGAASFERETGLSVTRDVLPGANGDAVLAVYPDADNPQHGADGLIVLDDANGANPAALADRVRAYAERASARQGGRTWRFTSENRNGAIIWTLDQNAQQDLQHSLAGGVTQAQRGAGMSAPGADITAIAPPSPPVPPIPPVASAPDAGNNGNNENNGNNDSSANHDVSGSGNSNENNGSAAGQENNSGNSSNAGDGSVSGNTNSGSSNENVPNDAHTSGSHDSGVDIHIHANGDGRVFDDSFALHHGDESVHIDQNGVNIHSHAGDAVVGQNGVNVRSRDGSSVAVSGNGVDIRAGAVSASVSNGGSVSVRPALNPAMNGDVQQAVGNKTVVFAQVGHAVLIASSRRMLDRGIAAYTSHTDTMADDPGYALMRQHVVAGAQNAVLLNLPSILEALRPLITRALNDNRMGLTAEDIVRLAGGPGNGLVATQQYDGKVARMTFFLPLDYEKAIHVAGALQSRR